MDGLGNHEPAEQAVAEPIGRVAREPPVRRALDGDELDRLVDDRLQVYVVDSVAHARRA